MAGVRKDIWAQQAQIAYTLTNKSLSPIIYDPTYISP